MAGRWGRAVTGERAEGFRPLWVESMGSWGTLQRRRKDSEMTPGLLAKPPPFPEDSATHPSTNPFIRAAPAPPRPSGLTATPLPRGVKSSVLDPSGT